MKNDLDVMEPSPDLENINCSNSGIILKFKEVLLSSFTNHFSFESFQEFINSSWTILTKEEKKELHEFILEHLESCISNNKESKQKILFLNKTIILVAKHDYPHAWPDFIEAIISMSKLSSSHQINTLQILSLLGDYFTNPEIIPYQTANDISMFLFLSKQASVITSFFTEIHFSFKEKSIIHEFLSTYKSILPIFKQDLLTYDFLDFIFDEIFNVSDFFCDIMDILYTISKNHLHINILSSYLSSIQERIFLIFSEKFSSNNFDAFDPLIELYSRVIPVFIEENYKFFNSISFECDEDSQNFQEMLWLLKILKKCSFSIFDEIIRCFVFILQQWQKEFQKLSSGKNLIINELRNILLLRMPLPSEISMNKEEFILYPLMKNLAILIYQIDPKGMVNFLDEKRKIFLSLNMNQIESLYSLIGLYSSFQNNFRLSIEEKNLFFTSFGTIWQIHGKKFLDKCILYINYQFSDLLISNSFLLKSFIFYLTDLMSNEEILSYAIQTFEHIIEVCNEEDLKKLNDVWKSLLQKFCNLIPNLNSKDSSSLFKCFNLMFNKIIPQSYELEMNVYTFFTDKFIQFMQSFNENNSAFTKETFDSLTFMLQQQLNLCQYIFKYYQDGFPQILLLLLRLYKIFITESTIINIKELISSILRIFIDNCQDFNFIYDNILPLLFNEFIPIYKDIIKYSYNSQFLSIFSSLFHKIQISETLLHKILNDVFLPTALSLKIPTLQPNTQLKINDDYDIHLGNVIFEMTRFVDSLIQFNHNSFYQLSQQEHHEIFIVMSYCCSFSNPEIHTKVFSMIYSILCHVGNNFYKNHGIETTIFFLQTSFNYLFAPSFDEIVKILEKLINTDEVQYDLEFLLEPIKKMSNLNDNDTYSFLTDLVSHIGKFEDFKNILRSMIIKTNHSPIWSPYLFRSELEKFYQNKGKKDQIFEIEKTKNPNYLKESSIIVRELFLEKFY